MASTENKARGASFAVLRQFVRGKPAARVETCELCSVQLRPDHEHLLELATRRVTCACTACAILFSSHAAPRYRRIPRSVRLLTDFQLDEQQWESLLIPINLAYFFESTAAGRTVAYYPSPAGATESLLDLEYWNTVTAQNPVLREMQPDVETLLVNRVAKTPEYFIAPIDQCYRLVGVIRTHWRGLSGGSEVWKQIDSFFAGLRQSSREVRRA